MRHKVFTSLILLAFIGMMSACEKEESNLESKVKLLTQTEIEDIGMKHNEALDYIFKELSSKENSKVKSSNDMENIIKAGLNKYSATLFTGEELDNTIKYSNKEVENYFGKRKVKSSEIVDLQYGPSMLTVIKENKDQFSKAQIKYLLKCESIFLSDKVTDMNSLIGKLDVIEESVKNDLSAEEAQVILIYLSVGRNSINYWNENLNDWTNKLSGSKSKSWWSEVWRATKEIAMYDAVGAGGAAVIAVAINVIPGVGQVAYATNIIMAGGVSSAVGAYEVYKKYDCEYTMRIPITIASVLKDDKNLGMAYANDFSKIETYSDDNIDLSNVALYIGMDSYFGIAGSPDPDNQVMYLYAFKSNGYNDFPRELLSIHIDEIEDKSKEIAKILVGSTTYGNLRVRPQISDLDINFKF